VEQLLIIELNGNTAKINGQPASEEQASDLRSRFEHDQAIYAQIMISTKLRRLELPDLNLHDTEISVP
jgi:hypothetical protein